MVALKASRMNNMNSDEMNDKAGLRIRIRIRIQIADPDPGGQN
jgi:hypothetical protein